MKLPVETQNFNHTYKGNILSWPSKHEIPVEALQHNSVLRSQLILRQRVRSPPDDIMQFILLFDILILFNSFLYLILSSILIIFNSSWFQGFQYIPY